MLRVYMDEQRVIWEGAQAAGQQKQGPQTMASRRGRASERGRLKRPTGEMGKATGAGPGLISTKQVKQER